MPSLLLTLLATAAFGRDGATVLWDETHGVTAPWGITGNLAPAITTAEGAGYAVSGITDGVLAHDLDAVGAVVITARGSATTAYTSDELDALEAFVSAGGGLLVACESQFNGYAQADAVANRFGIDCINANLQNGITTTLLHPVTQDLLDIAPTGSARLGVSGDATIIAWEAAIAIVAATPWGDGRVVVLGDTDWLGTGLASADNTELFLGALDWITHTAGTLEDGDGDGWDADCDDTRDDVHPGVPEVCDGADQDCNGDVDEGLPDADGDEVCDLIDLCEGDDAYGDADLDGSCDDADACFGDDTTGDTDFDGVCEDEDLCWGYDPSGDSGVDGLCNAWCGVSRSWSDLIWDETHGPANTYSTAQAFAGAVTRAGQLGFATQTLSTGLADEDLCQTGVVVVTTLSADAEAYTPAEIDALESFVRGGGGLLVGCEGSFSPTSHVAGIAARFGVTCQSANTFDGPTSVVRHPITAGIDDLHVNGAARLAVTGPARVVAWEDGFPLLAAVPWGEGRVVVSGDSSLFATFLPQADDTRLWSNVLAWLSHDRGTATDDDFDGWDLEQDCDDGDPGVHPTAVEVCDDVDQDCSGQADDGMPEGACGVDYCEGDDIWGDRDGDGVCDMGLTIEHAYAGRSLHFALANARPGTPVTVLATRRGLWEGCLEDVPVCTALRRPFVAAQGIADASGEALLRARVPEEATGEVLHFQAFWADGDEGATSPVVRRRVLAAPE